MTRESSLKIIPVRLGGMPIAEHFADKIGVLNAFEKHVAADTRDKIDVSKTLLIALLNSTIERFPLYKMGPWALDRRLIDSDLAQHLNDDRVGRALDRLFKADRAALLTDIILRAIKVFNLDTNFVHNDSTTVTLSGQYDRYSNTKAAKPKRGHNKDHRPDLKQLVFSLSVTGDGAVPLYFKVWDGNTTDDRTHIKNWMALRGLLGRADFTYVADSKLCTREQMEFIASEGGFFVTVLPQTRSEDARFKDWIQEHTPQWQEAIRKPDPKRKYAPQHVYWTFESPFLTAEGFRIVWVKSSQKEQQDASKRSEALDRTVEDLTDLAKKPFKSREKLETTIEKILTENATQKFFQCQIEMFSDEHFRQDKKGRPGPETKYTRTEHKRYRFTFSHNQESIRYAARCDGIFPLTTNKKETGSEILKIYKFQPRLEKRFSQLKSVYDVAPVFLKNPERIEALLFLYFVALLIDGLVERSVRAAMKSDGLSSIPIYPEARACQRPTADKIYDLFRDVRLQTVIVEKGKVNQIPDDLSEVQKLVLQLLKIKPSRYFQSRN